MDQSAGVLECWSAGVLECWSAGVPECWSAGVLECYKTPHPGLDPGSHLIREVPALPFPKEIFRRNEV